MSDANANSRVSRETVGGAVDALLEWMRSRLKQRKAQLLEHDDLLYLVLTMKKIPSASRINPYRIPLPHPLFDHTAAGDGLESSLFLIVDDRPKTSRLSPADALALARAEGLPVADCVGLSALGTDYQPFESRRRLCDSHDLFFADRAVLPLLPRLLGKHFFLKKKIPLPLDFSRPGWPQQLKAFLRSTFFYLRSGTCSGLKVGRVSMDREGIIDNVIAAVEGAVGHVPGKWANVRSFHVKALDSLALPVYQAVPEMGFKIDVPVAAPKKMTGFDDVEIEEEEQPGPEGGEVVESDEIEPKNSGESKKKGKKVSARKRIHEMLSLLGGEEEKEEGDDEGGVKKKRTKKDKEVASLKKRNKKAKKEDVIEEETDRDELDSIKKGVTGKKSKKKDKRVNKANSKKTVVEETDGDELGSIKKEASEKKSKAKSKKSALVDDAKEEEEKGEKTDRDELGSITKGVSEKKLKKSKKKDERVNKAKSKNSAVVDDAEMSVDDGEEEKGEETGIRRKREKAKKGMRVKGLKDKKDRVVCNGDDDSLYKHAAEEVTVGDELSTEKKRNEKKNMKESANVNKEKGKVSKRVNLLFSDEGTAVAAGLRKKKKT